MSVALNCNTRSLEDVEVISNIIKMRLKTKQLAGHYITCVRYSVLILFNKQTNQLGKKNMWVSGFPTLPSFWTPKSRPETFLLDHACKCFHLEENVCGKWKFEAILRKFIFGCGSTD